MISRILVYFQIVWICVAALIFRGVMTYPDTRIADAVLVGALYAFPPAALYAGIRDGNPWRVALAQSGLTAAYFLAILPGAQ